MIIYHHSTDLKAFASSNPQDWLYAGFIPTMGALHEGHLSLIKACQKTCKITIASIFVNPTQFNDPKDFEKYPNTIEKDIELLTLAGCDILYLPSVEDIYPNGLHHLPKYDIGNLENLLEGKYRPGHFQGVCKVMDRLLNIVAPSHLFMGEKDFQQCMVVQKLIETKNLPIQLHTCPTLREKDGLAMSSRNVRIPENQRMKATAIYKTLTWISKNLEKKSPHELMDTATLQLLNHGFQSVDYITIATPNTLQPISTWAPGEPVVILIAAFLADVRLIDNLVK